MNVVIFIPGVRHGAAPDCLCSCDLPRALAGHDFASCRYLLQLYDVWNSGDFRGFINARAPRGGLLVAAGQGLLCSCAKRRNRKLDILTAEIRFAPKELDTPNLQEVVLTL